VAEWAETALIGTPDQCVERIRAYQALGVTYFVCYFWGVADDPAPLRLFAEAVVPACQQVTRPAPS
jgi:alkanesulfonate monooxygenase SsuD/methylene tetrahydromethanopterin reductase-like flavin-dependent oxidoreductase (luciferase family)